jgi:hypothetical protein
MNLPMNDIAAIGKMDKALSELLESIQKVDDKVFVFFFFHSFSLYLLFTFPQIIFKNCSAVPKSKGGRGAAAAANQTNQQSKRKTVAMPVSDVDPKRASILMSQLASYE